MYGSPGRYGSDRDSPRYGSHYGSPGRGSGRGSPRQGSTPRRSHTISPSPYKYVTANTDHSIKLLLERPGTAWQKVIDKVGTFTGLMSHGTLFDDDDTDDEKKSPVNKDVPRETAKLAINNIGRIVKNNKANMKYLEQTQSIYRYWSKHTKDEFNRSLLADFSNLMSMECRNIQLINCRYDEMLKSLESVQGKEKALSTLLREREKGEKQLTNAIEKNGERSKKAEEQRELNEAMDWNKEVYYLQYNRALKTNLKESIVDYLLTVQSICSTMENESKRVYESIKNTEILVTSNESPKKFLRDLTNRSKESKEGRDGKEGWERTGREKGREKGGRGTDEDRKYYENQELLKRNCVECLKYPYESHHQHINNMDTGNDQRPQGQVNHGKYPLASRIEPEFDKLDLDYKLNEWS